MRTHDARVSRPGLAIRVLASLFIACATLAAMPSPAGADFETVQQASWGIDTRGEAVSTGGWDALGWSLAQADGHVYVGGNFLDVTNGWQTESQPYFARFDSITGSFDDSFRPDVGNAVYAVTESPDGGLLVGGEFGTWNGQQIGALAKINPTTGERWPGFETRVFGGSSAIRDIKIEADGWAYASGSFSTASSGGNVVSVANVVRFDPISGAVDASWTPRANGVVHGISRSKSKNVTYLAGRFSAINETDGTAGFAGVDDNGNVVVERRPDSFNRPNCPNSGSAPQYCSQMYDVEATAQGDVWLTGVEHATFQLDEATYAVKKAHFTSYSNQCRDISSADRKLRSDCRSAGGDGQELYVVGDTVYATCHCFGSIFSSDDPADITIPANSGWRNTPVLVEDDPVMAVSGVIAFDAASGDVDTSFAPFMSGTSGGWAVLDTDDGCLWVTGDFSQVGQPGVEATAPGRDLVRLCDGGVAPDISAPATCAATVEDGKVTLTWSESSHAQGYRIHRSIDGGSIFWRGRVEDTTEFTDTLRDSGEHRYFVSSVRPDGTSTNRRRCTPDVDPQDQQPVSAPVSCSVSASGQAVEVSWPGVDNVESYRIHRSIDGGTQFWRGFVQATGFSDTLRTTGQHTYFVSSVQADGTSTERRPCAPDADPQAQQPVTAPSSCNVTVKGQSAVVSWPGVGGADGYRVYRSVNNGPQFWRGRVDAGTQFSDELRPGSSHQYFVSSILPNGTATERTSCGNPVDG